MCRAAALLVIAGGLAVAPRAAAEEPLAVVMPDCPSSPVAAEAFLGSLRVELAGDARACCTRLAAVPPLDPGGRTTLVIEPCGATPDVVQVHIQGGGPRAATDRQVALGDVSVEARPRALALAVAELVRRATTPEPPPAPPPPALAHPAAAEPRDGWIPVVGFSARTHPSANLTLFGFHAGLELARGRVQAELEGLIESASPSVPLGSVNTTLAGGSLQLGTRLHAGQTAIDLGAVGSLGVVHMDGVTTAPGATVGSGTGLLAAGGGRAACDFWRIPHDRAHVRVMVEAGATIRGMEATVNGHDAAGVRGAYLLGGLAATLGPF